MVDVNPRDDMCVAMIPTRVKSGISKYLYAIIASSIIAAAFFYSLYYFDYFQTPSEDYIGNFRPRILEYMQGIFPGENYKILPLYPLIVALATSLLGNGWSDPVYYASMIVNMALLVPYMVLTYLIYRRFLSEKTAAIALLFLASNGFTVYTVANAELEMLLSFLVVLTSWLIIRKSRFAYFASFLTVVTKWDSILIIPASMLRDFFYEKKRIKALALGFIASTGFLAWMALGLITGADTQNPYIGEIARRGPNIYRFFIDLLFVASGFVQGAGAQVYYSITNPALYVPMYAVLGLFLLAVTILVLTGAWRLSKKKTPEVLSILMFLGGFILVHMVYQNTKTRYVLPILWLLNLLIFHAIESTWADKFERPASKRERISSGSSLKHVLAAIFGVVLYLASLYPFADAGKPAILIFALALSSLFGLALFRSWNAHPLKSWLPAVFACGAIIINLNCFFTIKMMDHYSTRRVEFKDVSMWYARNASPNDILLISETNLPRYYTGFPSNRFVSTQSLASADLKSLYGELSRKKITLIFIDDFYIRRLGVGDKNSIDKKAHLLEKLRSDYSKDRRFSLERVFVYDNNAKSYLLRFIPASSR